MPDREKVTNLIRELQRYEPQCTDYFKDVIDAVIELLKEQEAVSLNIKTNVNGIYYACGNCGEMMFGYKYCPTCGRRVKWG